MLKFTLKWYLKYGKYDSAIKQKVKKSIKHAKNVVIKKEDGIAMGSPLGPVIVGIFIDESEKKFTTNVISVYDKSERYVDDSPKC